MLSYIKVTISWCLFTAIELRQQDKMVFKVNKCWLNQLSSSKISNGQFEQHINVSVLELLVIFWLIRCIVLILPPRLQLQGAQRLWFTHLPSPPSQYLETFVIQVHVVYSSVRCCFCFDTGSCYIFLLSWNSLCKSSQPQTQKLVCFCLPNAEIKGVLHHHPQTTKYFLN